MYQQSCTYCDNLIYFQETDIIETMIDSGGLYLHDVIGVECPRCKTFCLIKD